MSPLIVHQLPRAPVLVGREGLLDSVRDFWLNGSGVASLVGIGGAGKTTLLAKVMDELIESERLDGALVWSFYDDPDTNAFLRTAVEYFGIDSRTSSHGVGWFHSLKQALDSNRRLLLILDGLERVQRQVTDAKGVYGELEDPLLRGLLIRIATATGHSKAIITSRFPVSDLERWNGKGHTVFHVDQLALDSSRALFESHGVHGSSLQFEHLYRQTGGHALTIDLLGAAIARFFGGDPAPAISSSDLEPRHGEIQTARLSAVLRLFEGHLPKDELDLMSRLCVFRFGVTIDSLRGVFANAKDEVSGALAASSTEHLELLLDRLAKLHLVHPERSGRFTVHPAIRDHFYGLFRDASGVHLAITQHLSSLTQRPGVGLPSSKQALDLLEELLYHALKSGAHDQAVEIYTYRMGGGDHLNVTLGEYSRTFRILSSFNPVPDPGAMYYCLRAFGRFDEALKWRPQNRYIKLIMGDLVMLRDDADEGTRKVARLLRAEGVWVPERAPDHPLCPAMLHLLVEQPIEAEAAAKRNLALSMHEDDAVRHKMALAELARLRRRLDEAQDRLNDVSAWVVRSGSCEHLAIHFLLRARQELDMGMLSGAKSTLGEALHIVTESKFRLLEIELRVEQARYWMAEGQIESALDEIRTATLMAEASDVGYMWGRLRALRAKVACLEIVADLPRLEDALKELMGILKRLDSAEWRKVEGKLARLGDALAIRH